MTIVFLVNMKKIVMIVSSIQAIMTIVFLVNMKKSKKKCLSKVDYTLPGNKKSGAND